MSPADIVKPIFGSVQALTIVIAGVLLVLLVREHDARTAAENELKLAKVARALEAKGLKPALPVADLPKEVAKVESASPDLKASDEGIRKAAPTAKPIAVASASTGQIAASGAPRPPVARTPAAAGTAASRCLLAEGDATEARVEGVWWNDQGVDVLSGAIGCYRLDPAPSASAAPTPVRLFGGPFSSQLTQAEERARPADAQPGLGVGLFGLCSSVEGHVGCAAGPELGFAPMKVWKARLELSAGLGAGPGTLSFMGSLMVRW